MLSRRRLFQGAAACIPSKAAFAAAEYDLLIRGDRIVAVRAGLPASSATEVIDAGGRRVERGAAGSDAK
jgi:dihydroorotase-like cyclic amidohydrolase